MASMTTRRGDKAKLTKQLAVKAGTDEKSHKKPAHSPADHWLKADSKGRIALGVKFANRSVIVEKLSETEVVVKLARVIAEREAWLYENAEALAAVRSGLSQARAGDFAAGPDLDAADELASQLEE